MAKNAFRSSPYLNLNTFSSSGELNVIIDTPQRSHNKFKYDPELGLFKLSHVLTAGIVFPYDFGYLPATQGEDGDPLDVLVLVDEPTFVGCLVPARLVGAIEADQTQEGKTFRNDRLIAVAVESHHHQAVQTLEQIGARLLDEIEHFFISYNVMRDRVFKPRGRSGPDQARQLVEAGMNAFKRKA